MVPPGTHFWAGNHSYQNNVMSELCLLTACSSAEQCQLLPSTGQAVLARAVLSNHSFSCGAFEKPQLLPRVETCQGHQSVASDTLHTIQ